MVMSSRHDSAATSKRLHFIREGQSEFDLIEGGADPMLFDPPLSAGGKEQAQLLCQDIGLLTAEIEVCICSPLTRSLEFAQAFFGKGCVAECPIIVNPLLRERVHRSCDIGSSPAVLKERFPDIDFSLLEGEEWFFVPDGEGPVRDRFKAQPWEEKPESIKERCEQFWNWLDARKEYNLAIVTNNSVIQDMTGQELDPGKTRRVTWKGFRVADAGGVRLAGHLQGQEMH
eukprot:CAMPEP_0114564382 /NCGR_PEP_ID=MMETSP0114-20121206/13683_1 /TAXON_ID=31324 /ORGANISM="Goniomonas sp, Strain m" /LENGTH=228 /DNA_ID=CAMNT_0001750431 /DNA_START=12 /DNA_END=699 /DNA_ORIENTATION=-